MTKYFKSLILIFVIAILSLKLYGQKDVTQFLGIPVDGYKAEMLKKLKSKGFTSNPNSKDILDGEFNGTDVNVFVVTNNNKVWRIAVADANDKSELDVKIRFNQLLQQFQNNKNYSSKSDSTILKYTIPEDEDISYQLTVKHKRYQAIFYQNTLAYDSLTREKNILMAKEKLDDKEKEKLGDLLLKIFQESLKSLDKTVWFTINERSGKYYIVIFYDNPHNKANGEDL